MHVDSCDLFPLLAISMLECLVAIINFVCKLERTPLIMDDSIDCAR